jgi:thioredoxin reductase (NADPH)
LEEGLFLSQFAQRVRIVQRGQELTASPLLRDKVLSDPRFEVHTGVELDELKGSGHVEEVLGHDLAGKVLSWHPAGVFVFIGMDPNSSFLDWSVYLDRWGFVKTDDAYRSSAPGLFAAGDVRAGSTKQLASAVGEGVAALLSIRSLLQLQSHIKQVDVNS